MESKLARIFEPENSIEEKLNILDKHFLYNPLSDKSNSNISKIFASQLILKVNFCNFPENVFNILFRAQKI